MSKAKGKQVEILHVFVAARHPDGQADHFYRDDVVELHADDVPRLLELEAVRLVSQARGAKADEQKAAEEVQGAGTDAGTPDPDLVAPAANAAPADVADTYEGVDVKTPVEPFEGDTADLDKDALIAELEKRDVEFDKRWGKDRLKTTLDDALAG